MFYVSLRVLTWYSAVGLPAKSPVLIHNSTNKKDIVVVFVCKCTIGLKRWKSDIGSVHSLSYQKSINPPFLSMHHISVCLTSLLHFYGTTKHLISQVHIYVLYLLGFFGFLFSN